MSNPYDRTENGLPPEFPLNTAEQSKIDAFVGGNPYGWYPSVQRAAWDQGYTAAQDEMTHLRADAEYAQVKQVAAEAERDALKLELDTARAEGHWAGMLRAAEIACDYDGDGISKSGQYWQLGDAGQTRSDIAAAIRAAAGALDYAAARAATDAECAK